MRTGSVISLLAWLVLCAYAVEAGRSLRQVGAAAMAVAARHGPEAPIQTLPCVPHWSW